MFMTLTDPTPIYQKSHYIFSAKDINFNSMIYLDNAATTPMSPAAIDAYRQAAVRFYGNPSSLHDIGSDSSGALDGSRKVIASLLNVSERGLRFTGSGSEANFLTLYSIAEANIENGRHLITTPGEHSSVRNTMTWLEDRGFEISYVPVNTTGIVDIDELKKALREDTILVSIQHVNSETGTIQPLKEIGDVLSNHQAVFHSDMVQSFCKLPVNPIDWGVQSCSVSAHKVHGPKGLGGAYIDPSVSWTPFIPDTIHEKGFRPGTVDTPAIVAFASAAKERFSDMDNKRATADRLKTLLIDLLDTHLKDRITLEGDPDYSSPYIAGLRLYGMEGQYAMLECSQHGLAISTGSACQVNEQKPSRTLMAMGRSEEEAMGLIRLSMDTQTTEQQIRQAVKILTDVVEKYLKRVTVNT
jgi:cysteine desulfurase